MALLTKLGVVAMALLLTMTVEVMAVMGAMGLSMATEAIGELCGQGLVAAALLLTMMMMVVMAAMRVMVTEANAESGGQEATEIVMATMRDGSHAEVLILRAIVISKMMMGTFLLNTTLICSRGLWIKWCPSRLWQVWRTPLGSQNLCRKETQKGMLRVRHKARTAR